MGKDSLDISAQLHQRLLVLIAQVERDRAALKLHQPGVISADNAVEGERVYRQLFDALQATLHNLNGSQAADLS